MLQATDCRSDIRNPNDGQQPPNRTGNDQPPYYDRSSLGDFKWRWMLGGIVVTIVIVAAALVCNWRPF